MPKRRKANKVRRKNKRKVRKSSRPDCPYCGGRAKLVTGEKIYPHRRDLYQKRFWECEPCDARVSCHEGTKEPMGRLADGKLRRAKIRAHEAFDRIWRSGEMSRNEAYNWLADQLGLARNECHIGFFSVEECRLVEEICNTREQVTCCHQRIRR